MFDYIIQTVIYSIVLSINNKNLSQINLSDE